MADTIQDPVSTQPDPVDTPNTPDTGNGNPPPKKPPTEVAN